TVLDEAIQDPRVGFIVAYHPPIFRAVKRLCLDDEKQAIALKCSASGISVFSPHTSLDACVDGINDWLARGLGAGKTRPITPHKAPPEGQEAAGSGRIHTLDTPAPLSTMIDRIKKHLQLQHVRVARGSRTLDDLISNVAICAGSGASVLQGVPADLYLTGEMSHHEVLAAHASNASVVLCEHSNTERGFLKEVLQPKLQKLLQESREGKEEAGEVEVEVLCSKYDRDPLEVV
ncbi:hypothetical protein HK102_008215, partial [Quaeritorhiza haematococci]